jgi:hypothetical protein
MRAGKSVILVLTIAILTAAAMAAPAGAATSKPVPVTLNEIIRAADAEMSAQNALSDVAYPYLGWRNNGGPWFNNVIDWLGTSLGDYGFVQGKDQTGDKYWVQEDSRSGNVWVPQYLSFQIVGPDGDADPADPAAYHFDHPVIDTFDPTSKYYPSYITQDWVMTHIGTPEEAALQDRVHLATSSAFTSPINTDVAAADANAIVADIVDVGTVSTSGTRTWSKHSSTGLAGKILFSATASMSNMMTLASQQGAKAVMTPAALAAYSHPTIDGVEWYPNNVRYAGGGSSAAPTRISLNISYQDAGYLTALCAQKDLTGAFPQMKLFAIGGTTPYSATTKLRTLIAEIRGTTKAGERIVVAAHVQEPGACDNASGVGAQLEVVRTLKDLIDSGRLQRPQRTITFIWGAETTMGGLWKGQNPEAFAGTVAVLDLDMVGEDPAKTGGIMRIEKMPDPSARYEYGLDTLPGETPPPSDTFVRQPDMHTMWGAGSLRFWPYPGHFLNDLYFASAANVTKLSPGFQVGSNPWEGGSDHDTFLWNRDTIDGQLVYNPKPAVLTWHFTDYVYHSSMDTMDKVSATELRDVGLTTIGVGYLVANADDVRAKEIVRIVKDRAAWRFGQEEQNSGGHLLWAYSQAVISGGTPAQVAAAVADALVLEQQILTDWGTWYKEAARSPRGLVGPKTPAYGNVEDQAVRSIDALEQQALANAQAIAASLTPPVTAAQ